MMDCHREYRILAGCNEEEEFEARNPRPGDPPRRKFHLEFKAALPGIAEMYDGGHWSGQEVIIRAGVHRYVGPVWADEAKLPAEEEMPYLVDNELHGVPVTEKHELPHGFELRTEAVRFGTEGKTWRLLQDLYWSAIDDPEQCAWSETKTCDGADAVIARIRKTVEHFRKALGG